VEISADPDRLASRLGVREQLAVQADGLSLIGANVDVEDLRPGEALRLTLFWIKGESETPDYVVEVLVGDTTVYSGRPVHGSVPFPTWQAGQVVADRYDTRIPRDFSPGERLLTLRLAVPADPSTNALEVELGSVNVRPIDRSFDLPEHYEAVGVDLGGQVELLGYALAADGSEPGGSIALTLFWRALTEMESDYTVFVHLIGPDSSLAGQNDGQPVGGTYPSSLWVAGEVVTDSRVIPLSQDLAPGDYQIEAGMYIAATGTRLADGASNRDSIPLQTIAVQRP
jgi:hypothetical protein